MSDIIANGTQEERDHIGLLYERFLLSGPARAGCLHADPHPGNFRLTPDGSCAFSISEPLRSSRRPPHRHGFPASIAQSGDAETVMEGLRAEGFVLPHVEVDPEQLLDYLIPSWSRPGMSTSTSAANGYAGSSPD